MGQQKLLYLLPYLGSLLISVGLAVYCWQHRTVAGAKEYSWVAVSRAFATLGFIFELLSTTLEGKLFWDNLQWFSLVFPVATLAFTITYTRTAVKHSGWIYSGLALFPILMGVLAFTDPLHGWIHPDARLIMASPFGELTYRFTMIVPIFIIYIYAIDLISFGILIRYFTRAQRLYQAQIATVIFGHLIPLITGVLILFGFTITQHRDITPFAYMLGNLLLGVGLFRYRLFDIVPVARERVFEQMRDLVVVVDMDNRVLDLNPAITQWVGKPAASLIGRPLEEAFPDQADLVAYYRDVTRITTEIKVQGPSGTTYFDMKISPLTNQRGDPIGRIIVSRDITALKRAHVKLAKQKRHLRKIVEKRTADLAESEERLRRLSEATFEGIILTEKGRIIEANQQVADIIGIDLAALIGRNLLDFVVPDGHAKVLEHTEAGDESPVEFQILKSDQTSLVVEARSRILNHGKRQLGVTAIRDITERKTAEESLRQSEERFRLIIDNMPILLDAFDTDGNIIVWNEACEAVTGYSAEEMIGNPNAMEILYPDPGYREKIWEAALNPEITDTTFDLVCKNGDVRTIAWFEVFRTLEIPGWAMWGMGQDITERRQAEKAIAQSAADLSRSNALITALAQVATQLVNTHDLTLICETVGAELKNLGMLTVINLLDETKQQLSTQYTTIDPEALEAFRREAGIASDQLAVPLPYSEDGVTREMMEERRRQIGDFPRDYLCRTLLAGLPREHAITLLEKAGIYTTTQIFWYPLIVKDQIVGTMVVWGHDLKESDSLALSVFAGQVASVILNAQLYQSEREQRQLAEALRDSSVALNSTLSLEEVLKRILDSLEQVLPHDAANVMMIESGTARIVAKRGYSERGLDHLKTDARWIVDQIPGLKRMNDSGEPLAIADTHHYPEWIRRPESDWIRSIVGAPIRNDNEVIGFLNLDSATPNFFSAADAIRLQAFAAQAGIGIQNARLYEAERRERILAQSLQKTAAALIRSINTQDTLTLIIDQLAEIVPYNHALLMVVEESHLRLVEARGLGDGHSEDVFPYSTVPVLRQILSSGQPLVLKDIQAEPNMASLPGIQPNTRAWIALPLITWGVVTGLLTIGSSEEDRFDERTLQAASAFAQQAAVAIENVRMVTELSGMVFNLREAQARLTRSARLAAAGEIAAGVAHQINNPLTVIVADISLILRNLPTDHPSYESAIAIKEAAAMAAKVVQRQLNLSRSVPYELQPTDINQSVSGAIDLVRAQISPVANLIVSLKKPLPLITASPEHLSDVWLNMLLNARDALIDKEDAQIRLESGLSVDGNEIVITIQDNGHGIPQDALGRIFDPFFTTKARGHGLGLPICYEIIRRHNGNIVVDSIEGVGTTMLITLPVDMPVQKGRSSEKRGNGTHSVG